jgi:hypothetical protein
VTDPDHIDDELAAELTQLIDGHLPPERRAVLEARIAQEPGLATHVERQHHVADRLRAVAGEIGAPARVRARVEADRKPARRRALAWTGALATGLAAAVLVALLVLPGGSPGAPSLSQAAAVGQLPPNEGPPRAASATLLRYDQDGVPFPHWEGKFGWVATGSREAKVEGREASTVYYRSAKTGNTVAYTIVGGDALRVPPKAPSRTIAGTTFSVVPANGRRVVTWERSGHTCILQGTAPTPKQLELASWRGQGSIPF